MEKITIFHGAPLTTFVVLTACDCSANAKKTSAIVAAINDIGIGKIHLVYNL